MNALIIIAALTMGQDTPEARAKAAIAIAKAQAKTLTYVEAKAKAEAEGKVLYVFVNTPVQDVPGAVCCEGSASFGTSPQIVVSDAGARIIAARLPAGTVVADYQSYQSYENGSSYGVYSAPVWGGVRGYGAPIVRGFRGGLMRGGCSGGR